MAITDHELRQRLEAAAGQARPPAFSVADIAGRISRRRARRAWAMSACAMAVIAAIGVAVPVGLAARSGPAGIVSLAGGSAGTQGEKREARPVPQLRQFRYRVTVNGGHASIPPVGTLGHPKPPKGCGQSTSDPCPGSAGAGFAVTPGEHLGIEVAVIIPAGARIRSLWFGISDGTLRSDRSGQPVDQQPILAHLRGNLEPGQHTYRLAWTVPDQGADGRILLLAATWTGAVPVAGPAGSRQPPVSGSTVMPITDFFVSR
jgi:hypothetical protein